MCVTVCTSDGIEPDNEAKYCLITGMPHRPMDNPMQRSPCWPPHDNSASLGLQITALHNTTWHYITHLKFSVQGFSSIGLSGGHYMIYLSNKLLLFSRYASAGHVCVVLCTTTHFWILVCRVRCGLSISHLLQDCVPLQDVPQYSVCQKDTHQHHQEQREKLHCQAQGEHMYSCGAW